MAALNGKNAVITGSSSGIGRQIARSFASEGARVVVNYHANSGGADSLVKEIIANGGEATAVQADISRQSGIDKLVAESRSFLNTIDVWVNNAGADILTGANARADNETKLARLLAVDLVGTMKCCWSILPFMETAGGGLIINMSWDLAIHGFEGRNPQMFSAVKAGVLGFSKSLALSCAPDIRVNVIAPGWIRTAFAQDDMDPVYYRERTDEIPLRRFGTPEDVAAAAVYLASDRATYLTGQVINVNGGLV